MFREYNANPERLIVGDCVIRAISKLLKTGWEDVYTGVTLRGYALHDMPSSNRVWADYLKSMGYSRHTLPDTCPDCYTVAEFCRDHPKGAYLLSTGSHVVAVENGDYYDTWDSGNETPLYYWAKGD